MKIAAFVSNLHLIYLLKILLAQIIVGILGRQNIVSNFLEIISIINVAGNRKYILETEHHLNGRTQLLALRWVVPM